MGKSQRGPDSPRSPHPAKDHKWLEFAGHRARVAANLRSHLIGSTKKWNLVAGAPDSPFRCPGSRPFARPRASGATSVLRNKSSPGRGEMDTRCAGSSYRGMTAAGSCPCPSATLRDSTCGLAPKGHRGLLVEHAPAT